MTLGLAPTAPHGFAGVAPRGQTPARERAAPAGTRPAFKLAEGYPDGLSRGQRRMMIGAVVAAHVALGWGLLQIREVREAVAEAAPMFVSLVAPPAPPKPVLIEPPPPSRPQPVVKRQRPPEPTVVTAAPRPAPAPFVAPAPLPEPPAPAPIAPPPPVAVAPVAPPPVAPAPAPAPKVIPASAVQYLEPISLEYPRLSKRNGEAGRVLIRVYIDEAGVAKNLQVNRSSGYPRLDEAALAAIQKARFRPYTENGQPVAGWAFIPLEFELEK